MDTTSRRKNVGILVALIALVLLATATPIIAATGRPHNATWVKSGYENGPVAVPASLTEIASLPLPRGNYAVSAKLWLWNSTDHVLNSDCRLRLGSDSDIVEEETPAVGHEVIALQLVGRLAAPGEVILECQAGTGVEANDIKITAVKASRLINVPLD